jgi:cytochrome c-type biogenesis protein CcmF
VTRIIGFSAIVAALALAVYGIVVSVLGARRGDASLARSGRAASYTIFGLLALSNLAMVYALVARDFSIDYVAQVGSHATPLLFTVISLWSALEGSILFWGLVLAGYTASAAWFAGHKLGALGAYSNATLLGIGVFFYMLLVVPANPWGVVFPVPLDGPGPNPLLQNHYLMAIHPPLLYLGYVGLSVPFAFAIGALLSGRLDDTWLRVTRTWTVMAWMFLSVAIMAGMWWSYEVLGWGGYWAWDPVENASFMPWLTATAFLHSAMVQERRGMLVVWNLTLIIATFLLTILGTFLTRSGVISSVHAFTQGTIGYYFLGFIAVVLVFSLVLLAGRSTELRTEGSLDSPASRESAFLLNNLLFVAFTFTVLLGTLFPLLAEAFRGVKVSVGAPFFNRMTIPICVALLFLLGVGPALRWRMTTPEQMKRNFVAPLIALAVVLVGVVAAGIYQPYTVLAFAFGAFALTANVQEFVRGAATRRSRHGEAFGTALVNLVRANNRRYGGYVAHIGLILMAVGITASSAFKSETVATLRPGETVHLKGYDVRFDSLRGAEEPHRFVILSELTVLIDGREVGSMDPRLNYYGGRNEPITTPAVRSRAHNDLYVTLIAFEENGANVTLTVIVEPLVVWIWIGGIIMGLGALIGLIPMRRARVRPRRTPAVGAAAEPPVPAGASA